MAELKDVHALAHTARMLVSQLATPRTLENGEEDPVHAEDIRRRSHAYAEQMTVYRMRWRTLSREQKDDIIDATLVHGAVTEDQLAAAVAAMEG